jgi:predicted amidophosphoribosyltransferase
VKRRPPNIGPLVCCEMCGRDTRSPSGVCRHCRDPETAARHDQPECDRRPTDPRAADMFDTMRGPPDTADPYHGHRLDDDWFLAEDVA